MLPAHGEHPATNHVESDGRQDLQEGALRWAHGICIQVLGTKHRPVCTVLAWESHIPGSFSGVAAVGHRVGVGLVGAGRGYIWAGYM